MILRQSIQHSKRPFVIAGPCSAESEQQVYEVVRDLASYTDVKLIRAGIWKPRTRPDSFEGLGDIALPWIVEAGKANGLPVTVEVANKQHVEAALKAGVDVLWIGARTTVNPFAVQEIADALLGVEIPVMIKNPVNPDLELWIGAFERLEKAGITDLVGLHRGFSFYNHPKYRNVPHWEIPIALKERLGNLPLICDPSHISGRRDLLEEVSQKAMDLNFDGLMIETHPNPDQALSDAQQQITPSQLKSLLENLVVRESNAQQDAQAQLNEYREQIEVLDGRLFDLFAARMKISAQLGEFKREHNITILQREHWENMIRKRLEDVQEHGLTRQFVRRVMDEIHQESIRQQTRVMNPKRKPE